MSAMRGRAARMRVERFSQVPAPFGVGIAVAMLPVMVGALRSIDRIQGLRCNEFEPYREERR